MARPRALVLLTRGNGDCIYINDASVALAFVDAVVASDRVPGQDDLQVRADTVVTALRGLNALAGQPHHDVGIASCIHVLVEQSAESLAQCATQRKCGETRLGTRCSSSVVFRRADHLTRRLP